MGEDWARTEGRKVKKDLLERKSLHEKEGREGRKEREGTELDIRKGSASVLFIIPRL